MNFAIGGKKGKKRGPAAAFNVATEEDEAKTRALAVQRQRASEMGFDAPAASSRPAKAAAAASSAPAAKAAKKAVDYSHLMGEAPTDEEALKRMGIGLPMSFGGSGRKEQKKAKVATFKATVQNPGRKKAAKAAPAAEKAEAAFDPSNNPDPWGSDDSDSGSDDDEENDAGPAGGSQAGVGRGPSEADERDGAAEDEDEGEDDDDGDLSDDGSDPLGLPVANSIVLKGHEKRISAVALDPAGSRCCTGSYDQSAKFWDFNGMNNSLKSFRSIEPAEGHQVRSISYSPTGGFLLIACHKPEAAIHDRDGKKLSEFAKGDPYRSDMIHTKGHIGPVNAAQWHPTDVKKAITCADDGTVRLWDTEHMEQQLEVIKVRNNRGVSGKGVRVSTCRFSDDGKLVAAGTEDGNLQLWAIGASGMANHNWSLKATVRQTKPMRGQRSAHGQGNITSIAIAPDGYTVASRSFDGTLKLWDLRKFGATAGALATFDGLANHVPETDVIFGPAGRYCLTGTSVYKKQELGLDKQLRQQQLMLAGKKGAGGGKGYELQNEDEAGAGGDGSLLFYDVKKLELVRTIPFKQTSVVKLAWHPRLNQIFVGDGDGGTHVHYTKGISVKGALLCANKAVAKKSWDQSYTNSIAPDIKNPHALPMYKAESEKRMPRMKDRDRLGIVDPRKAMHPEGPENGPGRGSATASSFTAHIMKQGALKDAMGLYRAKDPREALLAHAKAAAEDPTWISKAYLTTQPKTIFAAKTAEQEEDDSKAEFMKNSDSKAK